MKCSKQKPDLELMQLLKFVRFLVRSPDKSTSNGRLLQNFARVQNNNLVQGTRTGRQRANCRLCYCQYFQSANNKAN